MTSLQRTTDTQIIQEIACAWRFQALRGVYIFTAAHPSRSNWQRNYDYVKVGTHVLAMDAGRRRRRLLVNNQNCGAVVRLLLLLLLMSAQVDGTVYVRLWIHHALPNLFGVNNQENKAPIIIGNFIIKYPTSIRIAIPHSTL